jgi:hypothetical protein
MWHLAVFARAGRHRHAHSFAVDPLASYLLSASAPLAEAGRLACLKNP